MSKINWFGEIGLVTLLSKIKTLTDGKVDAEKGKGLSTNDFTDEYKDKLDGIETEASKYELPIATDNELGGIKIGAGLKIAADGTVSADIGTVYKYKGSVNTIADLPKSEVAVGDVYDIKESGANYAWTGSEWDALGGNFDASGLVEAEDLVELTAKDVADAWDGVFNA